MTGVISAFSYFFAKSVSVGILSRIVAAHYLRSIFVPLNDVPLSVIVLSLILIFGYLNAYGMKFGSRLQLGFMLLKIIPVLFIISFLVTVFDIRLFSVSSFSLPGFVSSLPIALYAILGFETCCSISHTIKGGAKRISKAIITSFILVSLTYTLFQLSLYCRVGEVLAYSKTPMGDFFSLVSMKLPVLNIVGSTAINLFIMLSMIGAYYGMVQANNWNLYAVAKEFKIGFMTKLNKYGIPVWCIFTQGLITFSFAMSGIAIVSLQRGVVFGVLTAYTLSIIALLMFYKTKSKEITLHKSVVFLSLISCGYIAYNCIKDII